MTSQSNIDSSEETERSFVSSALRNTDGTDRYTTGTDLTELPADVVLQQSLTLNSVISTTSSFARRASHPSSHLEFQQPIQIGEGKQGAIFEKGGFSVATKKEKPGNETLRSNLQNEFRLHLKVLDAFRRYIDLIDDSVLVPRPFVMVHKSDMKFPEEGLDEFPEGYRTPSDRFMMERILPLPKIVRRALVTLFYPRETGTAVDQATINSILNHTPNKHCLARTYLGKDDGTFERDNFSLRNFPLFLKSIEQLGPDPTALASNMGKAFAIMHWAAGVNGDDVEFVLGTSQELVLPRPEPPQPGFQHRRVGFYLLDFGQCESVDLMREHVDVVYQAFKGAMVTGDNQLFIPHYRRSPELFAAFKAAYIATGRVILADQRWGDKFSVEEFMEEYQEYAEDFLV
ncbi:hypothetical protein QBC33DRAFT_202714 [Phialemonium atrogriseum]|uniref:DUF3669 domain-containing protein n=1 Tax=Phialemonium atrogriseum TaxID=1093897 RepID=A0AAJ0BTM6_9PEZI|nr:uncharacterized protein QBC33DRAFT_202714 [Phialemonium atrogriseum]KAK1764288.1 hypothetical protein QBC33DRAFT_202714 [Phialemonium atrogriseum]